MSSPNSPFSLPAMLQSVSMGGLKSQRSSQIRPINRNLRISKQTINNTREILIQTNAKSSTRNESSKLRDIFGGHSNSASLFTERLESPIAASSRRSRINQVSKKEFANSLTSATFYGYKEEHGSSLTNVSGRDVMHPSFVLKRENKQERRETNERTLKLKQCISEYRQLIEKIGKEEPSSKKCRLGRKILETLSLENSQYQAEMALLYQDFESSVYCHSQAILEKLENNFPGVSAQSALFPQPYFELVKKLIKYLEAYKKSALLKYEEKDIEIANLSEQLGEKDKVIEELQYIIENRPDSREDMLIEQLKELVPKVEELQIMKGDLSKEILQTKEQVNLMAEKIQYEMKDYYENQINDVVNEKDNLKEEVKAKEMMIKELKLSIQKYTTLQKGSVIKLQAVKDENEAMRQRISFLEQENSKLFIRAAIGFEQLTPRPDLHQVLQHFNIKKTAKMNTQKKVEVINKAIEKIANEVSNNDGIIAQPESSEK